MRTELSTLKPECRHESMLRAKRRSSSLRATSNAMTRRRRSSGQSLEVAKRYVDEGALLVETAFQNDRVEMRVPPQHVSECLVGGNDTGSNGPTGSLLVELLDDAVVSSIDGNDDTFKRDPTLTLEDRSRW